MKYIESFGADRVNPEYEAALNAAYDQGREDGLKGVKKSSKVYFGTELTLYQSGRRQGRAMRASVVSVGE